MLKWIALFHLLLSQLLWAVEIAPVASYFQFEVPAGEGHRLEAWELWVVRPQVWEQGIPREVEILTSDHEYRHRSTVRKLDCTLAQRKELFATNRLLAQKTLENVYAFRLASVLRDYRVQSEFELPAAIREELKSILSGHRAFAVLQRPGGFRMENIELTVGVAYDYPGGLLTDKRLKGRAVLDSGEKFQGLSAVPQGPQLFVARQYSELGPTKNTGAVTGQIYEGGARAELTTFAKSDSAKFDLVPAIHQFMERLGMTRFGLSPLSESPPDSPVRYRRISRLSLEAVGYPGGRNALSRMYSQGMGFTVTHRIPSDPDFPESQTDLLEMTAHEFEHKLPTLLAKRPGGQLLEVGEIFPKYIHFGNAYPNGAVVPPIFFLQPSHEQHVAEVSGSCAQKLGLSQ